MQRQTDKTAKERQCSGIQKNQQRKMRTEGRQEKSPCHYTQKGEKRNVGGMFSIFLNQNMPNVVEQNTPVDCGNHKTEQEQQRTTAKSEPLRP